MAIPLKKGYKFRVEHVTKPAPLPITCLLLTYMKNITE